MKSKCKSDTQYDRSLLYGVKAIAAYMRFSEASVHKWIRKDGFPAGKLPNGLWASSTAMIDQWLMCRNPYNRLPSEVCIDGDSSTDTFRRY